MPELPTYTATGNIRGGPVAAGVPASVMTQQAQALVNVGGAVAGLSRDAEQLAAIAAQRKKENDFRAVNDASILFKDSMIKWENDPANQGREDKGEAYRQYADEQIQAVSKTLPSSQASELFKRSIMPSVQADWEKNLKLGEATRFENFKVSQISGSSVENDEYRNRATLEPEVAASLRSQQLSNRLASIQSVYGKIAPLQASAMSERAVVDAVNGAMDTDPNFARGLLNKHDVVDSETKRILSNRIDQAEANANASASFNELKMIENNIAVGYQTFTSVPMPDKNSLAAMPQNQRERVVYDVNVANGTISKFREVKAWNWQEQQKAIASIDIKGDPVSQKVRENLIELTAKSKEQQIGNPAGWQMANDPEFTDMDKQINAYPVEQRTAARMNALNRMVALQGSAPQGTSEEQAKRYLNLPTGLQNVLSVDSAKARSASFNNVAPNQLTKMVQDFQAEFPDPKLAAMAWNDMQNLPSGDSRLKMGIRVAAAINDLNVRNNFLGAMSNKDVIKTEDKKDTFSTDVDGNETYRRFVQGWIGDGNQRADELAEFRDSIVRYSMFLSAGEKLNTSKAVEKAVQRTIADNYVIVSIHGAEVPIYRFDGQGRQLYSDQDENAIQSGITTSLAAIDPKSIDTSKGQFPIADRLPADSGEQTKYLRKLIQATSTVAIEPDNESFTVYLKGEGDNDFPFQLKGYDGQPITWSLETMKIKGRQIQQAEEVFRTGSLKDIEAAQELKRSAAEKRLLSK